MNMRRFIVKTAVMHTSGDLIVSLSAPADWDTANLIVEDTLEDLLRTMGRRELFIMRDTEAHGQLVVMPCEKVDYVSVDKIEVYDGEN
jgi:hypothetical protein